MKPRNLEEVDVEHVMDYHEEDIMVVLKREYKEQVFESVAKYVTGTISGRAHIKDLDFYIECAAELVLEDHE